MLFDSVAMLLLLTLFGALTAGAGHPSTHSLVTSAVHGNIIAVPPGFVDTTFATSISTAELQSRDTVVSPDLAPSYIDYAISLPTTHSSSAVSIRPTGHAARFVPPQTKVPIVTVTLLLLNWATVAVNCNNPVNGDAAWSCFTSFAFAMAFSLSTWFRLFKPRAMDSHAELYEMHTHNYPGIEGYSTLQQLSSNYTDEKLLVVECNKPGAEGCFNVYYSNRLHPDGIRKMHKLESSFSGKKTLKREDLLTTASEGVDVVGDDGEHILGEYVFIAGAEDSGNAMGWDGAFPTNLAYDVASDAKFAKPGVVCLDVIDNENRELASAGYIAANVGDSVPDLEVEEDWLLQCEKLVLGGIKE